MSKLISDNYREMNSELHHRDHRYGAGNASKKWFQHLVQFVQISKPETILDYGCGKRAFAQAVPHLMVDCYDPAIPEYAATPEPADFVVCMDVMEHIEPELLDNVLDDLKRVTRKNLFLAIATGPAEKVLADGRNAHLIQEGPEWWMPKLFERFDVQSFNNQGDEFIVFATPIAYAKRYGKKVERAA